MTLTHMRCTDCGCKDVTAQRTYTIKHGEPRTIYACDACGGTFSSTSNTPMAHLKTPISVIVQVLSALTEGVGINAATRLYGVSKGTGSVSCNSAFVLHLCRFLNHEADIEQVLREKKSSLLSDSRVVACEDVLY